MSRLNSYISERIFMDGKDTEHTRLCMEDCALVDPSDCFCTVAARGRGILVGEPFAPLHGLSDDEATFLLDAMHKQKRIVLIGEAGAVLVFTEWLSVCGLLLAVRPHSDPRSVCRVLRLLGRDDFARSPACQTVSDEPLRSDAEVYARLNELLYYTDRLFAPSNALPIWTRTKLIAAFAGCQAECDALSVVLPPLFAADELRLFSFLTCLFLTARTDVSVSADERGEERTIVYCAEFCDVQRNRVGDDRFPFLRLPAFEDITLCKHGAGWALEVVLQRKTERVGLLSAASAPIGVRISFRFAA